MMLLSDKLSNIRANVNGVVREKLTVCIQQAKAMEDTIDSLPKQRVDDPDTSYFDGTAGSLKLIQQGLMVVFKMAYPIPLDELTMNANYVELAEVADWVKPVDPKKQDGTLRKRRVELQHIGLVELIDKEGSSPTGQRAARYRLTRAGLEANE